MSLFAGYDDREETEVWKEYKLTKSLAIREYFVGKYAALVKYVAGKISIGMPQNVEFNDLVSYGTFGLLDAIEKYDPTKEVKFKTYAMTRIRGSIFDELRKMDWVPRTVRSKAKDIERIVIELENRMGRTAEDHEVAQELDMSLADFHTLVNQASVTSLISLNDVWHRNSDSEEFSFIDAIESPVNMNPDVLVEREEVKNVIIEAIKKLPDKEKKVIVLYYYEDLTLKEIGEILEVTESRVSQLHTKAVMRLRGKLSQMKNIM